MRIAKDIQAVLMHIGSIIGVGMFALPFLFRVTGFWLGALELCILAAVVTTLHRWYAEIVLYTGKQHRLPGYVHAYLGDRATTLANMSALFGICGTLLAYLLLAGLFLDGVLKHVVAASSAASWSAMFVLAAGIITFFPLKRKTFFTSFLTASLIGLIALLVALLLPHARADYLAGFRPAESFAPYGAILFALSGATVIPDVVSFLNGSRTRTLRAITLGSIMPAVIYFFFALAVVGASGPAVSPDAISGLQFVIGSIAVLGNIIGLLAVSTAYILLNSSFQAFLILDLGVSRALAWAGGSCLPLFLFLIGLQNFISVISTIGATTIAIDGGLIIATYHTLLHKREKTITTPDIIRFGLIYGIFIAGLCYELYGFIWPFVA